MKTTSFQYAKALFEATEHSSEREAQDIIVRFADRLQRDGQTKQLHRIIDIFTKLWNASQGIVEASVISHTPLDEHDIRSIEQSIGDRYHANKVIITNRVDDTIGGGVVIRIGDEVFDGSVATQLSRLRKHLGAH